MTGPVPPAFLGVGWAFPPKLADGTGATDTTDMTAGTDVQLAAYEQDVRQAVRVILDTEPGERVMRPDFGAGLRALVFEPVTTTTLALVRHRVEVALLTWEPRIDSLEAVVAPSATERGRLDVSVRYRIRATNTFYNLVYPFYLREGDAG